MRLQPTVFRSQARLKFGSPGGESDQRFSQEGCASTRHPINSLYSLRPLPGLHGLHLAC